MNEPINEPGLAEWQLAFRRAERSRRAREGMAARAASGVMPGRIPLGYRWELVGDEKRAAPDPETAPFIREAFRLAASGVSVRRIVAKMEQRGLRASGGGRLGAASLARILANPIYCGMLSADRSESRGHHEAIISRWLYLRARKGILSRTK